LPEGAGALPPASCDVIGADIDPAREPDLLVVREDEVGVERVCKPAKGERKGRVIVQAANDEDGLLGVGFGIIVGEARVEVSRDAANDRARTPGEVDEGVAVVGGVGGVGGGGGGGAGVVLELLLAQAQALVGIGALRADEQQRAGNTEHADHERELDERETASSHGPPSLCVAWRRPSRDAENCLTP
jgi:hypothetical protein